MTETIDGDTAAAARGRSKPQQARQEKLAHLYKRRPEFRWAHPFSFVFYHIPIQVSEEKLQKCIEDIIAPTPPYSIATASSVKTFRLHESKDSQTWEAILQFPNRNDFDRFESYSKRVNGVRLQQVQEKIPGIEEEVAATKKKVEDAEAMRIVHPCAQNERNLTKAKAAHETARLGLCVTARENHRAGHILCSRAFGNFRDAGPKTSLALKNAVTKQVEAAAAKLAEHSSIISQEEKTIQSIEGKLRMNVAGTAVENLLSLIHI